MYPDVSRCIRAVFAENQTCDFCETVVQNGPGYIRLGCIQMYPDVSGSFFVFFCFFCFFFEKGCIQMYPDVSGYFFRFFCFLCFSFRHIQDTSSKQFIPWCNNDFQKSMQFPASIFHRLLLGNALTSCLPCLTPKISQLAKLLKELEPAKSLQCLSTIKQSLFCLETNSF